MIKNNNIFLRLLSTLLLSSTILLADTTGYMTTMFINGDGSAGGTSREQGIVKYFLTPTTQSSDTSVMKDLVEKSDTGDIFGMGYDNKNKVVCVSSVSTLSDIGIAILVFMQMLTLLFFFRKEEYEVKS